MPNGDKIPQSKAPTKVSSDSVPMTMTFKKDLYTRLAKYTKDKTLPKEQDVIRLALVSFLERAGY